jgi:hypothetical protein
LIRFVSVAQEQAAANKRYRNVLVLSVVLAVLAAAALVAFPERAVQLGLILGLSVLATALFGLLLVNGKRTQNLSGDDLIDLIVVPQGFVTQGGFRIDWPEVKKVEVATIVPRQVRGSAATNAGAKAAERLTAHDGSNVVVKLHLHDCKAAIARTTTKMQKLALIDDIGGRGGHAHVALGLKPQHEVDQLVPVLQREAAAHGVPFERTAG